MRAPKTRWSVDCEGFYHHNPGLYFDNCLCDHTTSRLSELRYSIVLMVEYYILKQNKMIILAWEKAQQAPTTRCPICVRGVINGQSWPEIQEPSLRLPANEYDQLAPRLAYCWYKVRHWCLGGARKRWSSIQEGDGWLWELHPLLSEGEAPSY